MSVVIRMKKMGRKHRHFFRICATDPRNPRDGRVIEEIGTYDPHVPETDARTSFNEARLQYWLGTGAKPSDRVAVLIKKYGPSGTHKQAQTSAREKLSAPKSIPDPGAPKYMPTTMEQGAAAQSEAAQSEAAQSEAAQSEAAQTESQSAAAAEETENKSRQAAEQPEAAAEPAAEKAE